MKKLKEILLLFGFNFINLLLSIVFTPYFLKHFSKSEYGLIILVSQIIGFIVFVDLGVTSFVIQKIASKSVRKNQFNRRNRLVSSSVGLLLLISIVALPLICWLVYRLDTIFEINFQLPLKTRLLIFLCFVSALISLVTKPYTSLLIGEEKINSMTLVSNLSAILYSILCYVFVVFDQGISSFFYAYIISNIFSIVSLQVTFSRMKSRKSMHITIPKKKEIYYFIGGGFFLFLNGIAAQIIYNGDRIIAAKFISIEILTIFAINIRMVEIIQNLVMKISDIYIPKIVRIVSKSLSHGISYYGMFTRLTCVVVMLVIFNVLLFNKAFITLWVGPEYIIRDKQLLVFYLVVLFSHLVFRIPSLFLYAINKTNTYGIVSVVDAALNLGLSILFLQFMDIKGIVLATLVSSSLTSVPSNFYFLNKYYGLRFSFKAMFMPILRVLLYSFPLVVAAYFLSDYLVTFQLSWLSFILLIFFANMLVVPLIIWLNYRKKTLFLHELKSLNSEV